MGYETILVEQREKVCRITLNRPDSLNSFTIPMHEELAQALDDARDDPEVRVILLTGAGRGFCAGQDLSERKRAPGDPPFDLAVGLEKRWGPLIRRMTRMPKPIVCAVNGVAAGAGANLAFACDMTIARDDVKFLQAFVNIGLAPDAGGTWLLPRLAGLPRALGFAMLGEPITAATAADWGMIWKAVPAAAFEIEVARVVDRLASLPGLSLAAIKRSMRGAFDLTLEQQLDLERDQQQRLGYSEDYAEGVLAFAEKRQPQFNGR
ncbi:MAG: 2-(1,2-epoxy-1,2-dihydrophenyl)acetyl-CoA isomerase PaaG [Candidatus Sphingomonas phytovorans]|nr:enoyl-CoA hydratase-related protein [Sphingomonas sp.]WEK02212.1 MAG: 2-(1,2-epoxy-1,2-dihydrophenyl)acetyl-CoA isomerase PaaG [Sphingomonas sp.]